MWFDDRLWTEIVDWTEKTGWVSSIPNPETIRVETRRDDVHIWVAFFASGEDAMIHFYASGEASGPVFAMLAVPYEKSCESGDSILINIDHINALRGRISPEG